MHNILGHGHGAGGVFKHTKINKLVKNNRNDFYMKCFHTEEKCNEL